MINGAHCILYCTDAVAARAFFRDVLKMPSVDAGNGWLIFALPPAELAAHPADPGEGAKHELFLMCDDIEGTVADLKVKGVEFTAPLMDRGWGIVTSMKVPGAGSISLYQPRHAQPSHS